MAAISRASRRVSGSPVELVDDDSREDRHEDPRDLRARSRGATRRRATRGMDAGTPSSRTNVRRARAAAASRLVRRTRPRRVRIVLEAVPNVSEGRDAAVDRGDRAGVRDARARPRRALRPGSPPIRVHARRRRATRSSSRSLAGHRNRGRAGRPARARRRASAGRRRRRRPARSARPDGHGARDGGRAARRRARSARSSAYRSSSTARSAAADGRRSSGAAGSTSSTRRVEAGELVPDAGPHRIDPRSGAVLVGARDAARRVQPRPRDRRRRHRARSRGGRARVERRDAGRAGDRALPAGLRARAGEHERRSTSSGRPFTRSSSACARRRRARRRGRGGELVGLVPERVLDAAERAGVELPGVDESQVLERAARF